MKLNWGKVRTGLPEGEYTGRIVAAEYVDTPNKGYLALQVVFAIETPVRYAGMSHRELWVIGNENDPSGEEEETWYSSIGARRISRLFKAMGETIPDDPADIPDMIVGWTPTFLIRMQVRRDTGDEFPRISRFLIGNTEHDTDGPQMQASPEPASAIRSKTPLRKK